MMNALKKMPCSYSISQEGEITYIYVIGTVTGEVIETILKEIWQGKNWKHPCVLWDFRFCMLGFGSEKLKDISNMAAGEKGERGYGRVALVVSKYIHFKLSKMYESYLQDVPFEIKTFLNVKPAQKWLNERGISRGLQKVNAHYDCNEKNEKNT